MKLYCPDVFIHTAMIVRVERTSIFGNKPVLTCVHVCEAYIAFSLVVHMGTFLGMLVYFSLAKSRLLISFYWRMIIGPEGFPEAIAIT